MIPYFIWDWQGRVVAWTLGPLLVLFSLFIAITSVPWTIGEAVGWGSIIAVCLFSAAVMLFPRRLPWGDLVLTGVLFLAWLGHSIFALFGPAPWVPLLTFVFVGGPAGLYFFRQYLRGNFIFIAREHPLFKKAKIRSAETWSLFRSLYAQAPESAWIKLPQEAAEGSPYLAAGLWVGIESVDEHSARVRLGPDGNRVDIALEHIQDWRVALPDGTLRGAFSDQALRGAFRMQLARPPLWLRRMRFADPLD